MTRTPVHTRPVRLRAGAVAALSVLLVVAGALLGLRYDTYHVGTTVMDPAVSRGQWVLTAPYRSGESPAAGDVVVVRSDGWQSEPPGAQYILRVVAVGGDKVTCCDRDGRTLVNGTPPAVDGVSGEAPGSPAFEGVVPPGRVFLLGDRRDVARDSRAYLEVESGTVPVAAVVGRVVASALPPRPIDGVRMSANPLSPTGGFGFAVVLLAAGTCALLWLLATWASRARARRSAPAPGSAS